MNAGFEQGARTAWHTHPLGQTLRVLTGVGHARTWDGPVRELRPGDTVSVSMTHYCALLLLNDWASHSGLAERFDESAAERISEI